MTHSHIVALAALGTLLPAAVPALAQEAAGPPPEATPAPAVEAAELTFDQALHQLYALRSEDRQAALRRLSDIADPACVPNVVLVLRQDPDENVRRYAAIALGNIGGTAALPDLQQAAAADPADRVRRTAEEVVRRLGGTPASATVMPVPVPTPVPAPTPVPVPVPSPAPIAPVGPITPVVPIAPQGPSGIAVLESRGAQGALGGQTELSFSSDDAGLQISRVVGRATARDSWSGTSLNVEAVASEPVCVTPCRILVANGSYSFLAGSYEFGVSALGGSQAWDVEDESSGMYWGGMMLTSAGLGFLLGAVVGLAVMDDLSGSTGTMMWAFLGVGIGATVVGIPIWVMSSGEAEMRPGVAAAAPAAGTFGGLYLLPGFAARDPVTGESGWGMGLRLTL